MLRFLLPSRKKVIERTSCRLDHPDLETLAGAVSGHEIGEARFWLDWKWRADGRGRAIITPGLILQVSMPEWTRFRRRPKAEQDEWTRFYNALRFHEEGHTEIFRRGNADAYRRLNGTPADAVRAGHAQAVSLIQAQSDEYDRLTGHGTLQDTPFGSTAIDLRKL